jgi:RND family efflux transporter MFP subunit
MSLRRPRLLVVWILAAAAALAAAVIAFVLWTRPPAATAGRPAPADARAEVWVCPMHPEVTSDRPGTCPKCGMDLVKADGTAAPVAQVPAAPGEPAAAPSAAAAGSGTAPRAPLSIELRRQQLIGVRTATVARRPLTRTIRTVGQVQFDETRQAEVTLKVEAFVQDLYVNYTGQYVQRGQPLFSAYSPDLLATQHEYVLALESRDRLETSRAGDAREYAERLVSTARRRLALWDLPDEEIDRLDRTREPRPTLIFRSPASGFVVEKRVVAGMRVGPGDTLYRLADLAVVWVEGEIYEPDVAFVRTGSPATVTLDAWPGETFKGRITYIHPSVDPATRTVRVRLELPNPGGRLKPGMYANVELSRRLGDGLLVPADAVVDSGREQFVFVALGDGYFEPRPVRTGHRLGGEIQILDGVAEGELVATAATFFLDSESQLRAAMQGFTEPPPIAAGAGGAAPGAGLDLSLRTEPDPPRHGDSTFIVTVRDAQGAPVADAEVLVRLYMAPMPSMNMPAMSAEAPLVHAGGGVYRGRLKVPMAGRWDATVVVSRHGARLDSRPFAIVAR